LEVLPLDAPLLPGGLSLQTLGELDDFRSSVPAWVAGLRDRTADAGERDILALCRMLKTHVQVWSVFTNSNEPFTHNAVEAATHSVRLLHHHRFDGANAAAKHYDLLVSRLHSFAFVPVLARSSDKKLLRQD
jgi:hypothetical protein